VSITAGRRHPSGHPGAVAGWVTATGEALQRPLASYYLLLGSSALLLTLGLMMVLSASSVYSFEQYGTSYHYFLRQLTWVVLALPIAFLASRLRFARIRFTGG